MKPRGNPASGGVAWVVIGGMVLAVAAAWLAPEAGRAGGALHTETAGTVGIMLIFLALGLQLPSERFARSLVLWRFHLYVQVCGFALFPLFCVGLMTVAGPWIPADLRLGFLYLAVLPSTISSAIVFVTAARGDSAAAIASTALSNVAGVFFVPLACAWMLSTQAASTAPAGVLIVKVGQLLLLPLVAGQLLRPWLGSLAERARRQTTYFNHAVILFLVYASFCDSFASGVWQKHGVATLAWAGGGALALLLASTAAIWTGAGALGFDRPLRITALFCASQKTLAAGVPLAGAIFGGVGPDPGLLLLPLLFYHPLQLALGSFLLPSLLVQGDGASPSPA